MRIEYLYRFPIKGLSAEAIEMAAVDVGGAIPWDRAFALARSDSAFDPAAPAWRHKSEFMCLLKDARIARLVSLFDDKTGTVAIRAPDGSGIEANGLTPNGRDRIGAFLAAYLGGDAGAAPVFHRIEGHVFGDQRAPVVSLINLASHRDYEAKVGGRRHRRRFRANAWFSGVSAWAERDWVGQRIQMGGAVLRITKGTVRCAATEVNPETGERDAAPVAELRALYGHTELGIHAEVVEAGRFAVGDAIEVLGD